MIEPVLVFGIPVDFILFALTLLGVALFHHHTLRVALTGLAAISLYKIVFTGFKSGPGLGGLGQHMAHEWVILANLFLLLMGFALLSRHFEESRIPDEMPALLPDDWKGGVALCVLVFVLSSFLDNIAAALIGGTVARHVFQGKVHIGYLAAIVAASNAGGSGSVVGDTTTTMMWIAGVSPLSVVEAYVAADRRDADFRGAGIDPATALLADRQKSAERTEDRRRPRPHRRGHSGCGAGRQHHRQPEISCAARHGADSRARSLGGHPAHRAVAQAGLVGDAGNFQRHDLPAGAGDGGFDDAG